MYNQSTQWYAVKVFAAKSAVLKDISSQFETYTPVVEGRRLFPSLLFVRCTAKDILAVKEMWYHQVFLYRDAERINPQPISEAEMANFRMVLNVMSRDYIPIVLQDNRLLVGQKVRVKEGPFKGAVGVVKRLKGTKRLVVAISGIVAIATCYLPQELLEPIDE